MERRSDRSFIEDWILSLSTSAHKRSNRFDSQEFAIPSLPASAIAHSSASGSRQSTPSQQGDRETSAPSHKDVQDRLYHSTLEANHVDLDMRRRALPDTIQAIVSKVDAITATPLAENAVHAWANMYDELALFCNEANVTRALELFFPTSFPPHGVSCFMTPVMSHSQVPQNSLQPHRRITTPLPDILYGYRTQSSARYFTIRHRPST